MRKNWGKLKSNSGEIQQLEKWLRVLEDNCESNWIVVTLTRSVLRVGVNNQSSLVCAKPENGQSVSQNWGKPEINSAKI